MMRLKMFPVFVLCSFLCVGSYADAKPSHIERVDSMASRVRLDEKSKLQILSMLRQHILSYAHLERKAALYDLSRNLFYALDNRSIAKLDDAEFFGRLMKMFANQRDSHTRFYYPEYMSCRRASIPIEFRFFRDSDRNGSWGKVIVYDIKDRNVFRGVNVGDELVQYEDSEIRPLFRKMREYMAESERGFYETAASSLNRVDGRFQQMPQKNYVYLLFKDYKSGMLKEIEVDWEYDYSRCSKVPLYEGIPFPKEKEKDKERFVLVSRKYGFEKIENPLGITDELYVAGILTRRGMAGSSRYGFIKFFNFKTFQNEEKDKEKTINEFIDKTLISLGNLMNIFARERVRGLIIDVRMNPGGWIEFAHHIARVFSRGSVRSVVMQFANGDMALDHLMDEIKFSENEVKSINKRGAWSGLPYSRNFFNWDNYRVEIEKVKGLSLRLARGIPHFKTPVENLNPLLSKNGFPKVVLADRCCISSCDMFVAMMKENGIGKIVGESTRGGGGMVYDGFAEVTGSLGAKKIKVKIPFRYAYTNVLTPDLELIEDVGVEPDVHYGPNLAKFRAREEDTGWIDKAVAAMRK